MSEDDRLIAAMTEFDAALAVLVATPNAPGSRRRMVVAVRALIDVLIDRVTFIVNRNRGE